MTEYKYALMFRPFSSESYPTDNVVRIDPPKGDAKFGIAVYSVPVENPAAFEMSQIVDGDLNWIEYVRDSIPGDVIEEYISEPAYLRQIIGICMERAGVCALDMNAFVDEVTA